MKNEAKSRPQEIENPLDYLKRGAMQIGKGILLEILHDLEKTSHDYINGRQTKANLDKYLKAQKQAIGVLKTEKKILTDIEPARFTHDCDVCKYLGRYQEYDLYFCKEAPTVVGRFSSKGADYTSGMAFATHEGSRPLYEAKQRAIKQGLINEN